MRGRLAWAYFMEETREATPATRRAVGACLPPALGIRVVFAACESCRQGGWSWHPPVGMSPAGAGEVFIREL